MFKVNTSIGSSLKKSILDYEYLMMYVDNLFKNTASTMNPYVDYISDKDKKEPDDVQKDNDSSPFPSPDFDDSPSLNLSPQISSPDEFTDSPLNNDSPEPINHMVSTDSSPSSLFNLSPENMPAVSNINADHDSNSNEPHELSSAADAHPNSTPDFTDTTPSTPDFTDTSPSTPDFTETTPSTPDFTDTTPSTPDFTDTTPSTPDSTSPTSFTQESVIPPTTTQPQASPAKMPLETEPHAHPVQNIAAPSNPDIASTPASTAQLVANPNYNTVGGSAPQYNASTPPFSGDSSLTPM